MSSEYGALRDLLASEYASLDDEQLEAALALQGLDADALESLWGSLANFGRQVAQRLPAIAQGAIQGGITGAPMGLPGLIGGTLTGGLIGGLTPPGARPRLATPAAPPVPGAVPQPPGAPVPAAAQLMAVLTNPQILQALTQMLLGRAGAPSVPIAGTPVPVAAAANLIGTLATQAAAEYQSVHGAEATGHAAYLFSGGEARDWGDPGERAAILLELVVRDSAASWSEAEEPERPAPSSEWSAYADYDPVYGGVD
jgi:hypothetical protein